MHSLVKIINKYNGNLCLATESPDGFLIIECNVFDGSILYDNSSMFIKDICVADSRSYLVTFGNNWIGKFEEGSLNELCADTMISNVDQIEKGTTGNYYILNRNLNQLIKLTELPLCDFSSISSSSFSSFSSSSSSVDSSSSKSTSSSKSSSSSSVSSFSTSSSYSSSNSSKSSSSSSTSSESIYNFSSSSSSTSSKSSFSSSSSSSTSSSSFSLSFSSSSTSSQSNSSSSSRSSFSSNSSSSSSLSSSSKSSESLGNFSSSSKSSKSSSSSSSDHIRIGWIFDLPDYDLRQHGNIIFRESDNVIIFYNRANIHTIKDAGKEAILMNSVEIGSGDLRVLISSQFKPLYGYLRYRQVTGSHLSYSSSSSSS